MRGWVFLGAMLFAVSASAASQDARTSEPGFVVKALQLLYGNDIQIGTDKDTGEVYAIWKSTETINHGLFPNADREDEVISKVNLALPVSRDGVREYLVLTSSNPYSSKEKAATNGCHVCAPALGGIVMREDKGQWKAVAKTFHIADLGSWGETPEGQLILIGPDRYAIRFDSDYRAQGDTNDAMTIVGIAGDQLKVAVDIATGASDMDGSCTDEEEEAKQDGKKFNSKIWCYEYSSEYRFIAGDNPDYYDLVVTYGGTDVDDKADLPDGLKISDVSRVDTYKWDEKGYKLISSVKTKPQHVGSDND